MIRVLIADDYPIVRLGIKALIQGEADMEVAGEAGSADELLRLAARLDYDVVLTDFIMPDKDGLEILQDLEKLGPGLPVLVMSVHPEDQYGVRALRAGAAGYITKGGGAAELLLAIRRVASGRKYVSPELAEVLATRLNNSEQAAPHEKLSEREYAVLCMLASGKTTGDIARHLSLSVKTVSTYRTRTLKKLRLRTNADLIAYAIRHYLCE